MQPITDNNKGYFRGYSDGREDMRKILTQDLWEYANRIEEFDPDLHTLITKLIIQLEGKK